MLPNDLRGDMRLRSVQRRTHVGNGASNGISRDRLNKVRYKSIMCKMGMRNTGHRPPLNTSIVCIEGKFLVQAIT